MLNCPPILAKLLAFLEEKLDPSPLFIRGGKLFSAAYQFVITRVPSAYQELVHGFLNWTFLFGSTCTIWSITQYLVSFSDSAIKNKQFYEKKAEAAAWAKSTERSTANIRNECAKTKRNETGEASSAHWNTPQPAVEEKLDYCDACCGSTELLPYVLLFVGFASLLFTLYVCRFCSQRNEKRIRTRKSNKAPILFIFLEKVPEISEPINWTDKLAARAPEEFKVGFKGVWYYLPTEFLIYVPRILRLTLLLSIWYICNYTCRFPQLYRTKKAEREARKQSKEKRERKLVGVLLVAWEPEEVAPLIQRYKEYDRHSAKMEEATNASNALGACLARTAETQAPYLRRTPDYKRARAHRGIKNFISGQRNQQSSDLKASADKLKAEFIFNKWIGVYPDDGFYNNHGFHAQCEDYNHFVDVVDAQIAAARAANAAQQPAIPTFSGTGFSKYYLSERVRILSGVSGDQDENIKRTLAAFSYPQELQHYQVGLFFYPAPIDHDRMWLSQLQKLPYIPDPALYTVCWTPTNSFHKISLSAPWFPQNFYIKNTGTLEKMRSGAIKWKPYVVEPESSSLPPAFNPYRGSWQSTFHRHPRSFRDTPAGQAALKASFANAPGQPLACSRFRPVSTWTKVQDYQFPSFSEIAYWKKQQPQQKSVSLQPYSHYGSSLGLRGRNPQRLRSDGSYYSIGESVPAEHFVTMVTRAISSFSFLSFVQSVLLFDTSRFFAQLFCALYHFNFYSLFYNILTSPFMQLYAGCWCFAIINYALLHVLFRAILWAFVLVKPYTRRIYKGLSKQLKQREEKVDFSNYKNLLWILLFGEAPKTANTRIVKETTERFSSKQKTSVRLYENRKKQVRGAKVLSFEKKSNFGYALPQKSRRGETLFAFKKSA